MSLIIDAVVLAAGYSSRMGFFKPISPLNGVSPLRRVVTSLKDAGTREVVVVTGYRGDETAELAVRLGAVAVENPLFPQGMFSSVRTGVCALALGFDAFFLLPVDIPSVRTDTLRILAAKASRHGIVHPVFLGERGHPPLVGASITPHILASSGEGGLRAVFNSCGAVAEDVPVTDEGILLDMDTPEDYEVLRRRCKRLWLPSRREETALWQSAGTPARVRRHCEMVSSVSMSLGLALAGRGLKVNVPLLRGAALFHDVCRHEKDHAAAGATFLEHNGFSRLARIASGHRDLPANAPIEARIVHLADKVVKDTSLVSLEERMEMMRSVYGEDPIAWRSIREKFARARRTSRMIERATGLDLHNLLKFRGKDI